MILTYETLTVVEAVFSFMDILENASQSLGFDPLITCSKEEAGLTFPSLGIITYGGHAFSNNIYKFV